MLGVHSVTSVTDLVFLPASTRGVEKPLRCIGCDVTWRGTSADVCWNCGALGVPLGNLRFVEDEPGGLGVEDEPGGLGVEDEPWGLGVEDEPGGLNVGGEPAELGIEGESAA